MKIRWGSLGCGLSLLFVATTTLAQTNLELRNERLTMVLGRAENGAVISLVERATGRELVAKQTVPQLFRLAFSKQDTVDGKRFYLSSHDAKEFKAGLKQEGGKSSAILEFGRFGEWPVHVTCTASVSDHDPLVRWRLNVQVPPSLILEDVQFPQVVLRAPLGKTVENDALVIGVAKGGVIRRPGAMKTWSRISGRNPGYLAAQFGCYYDNQAGFYTAAYDGRGYPKDLEMTRTKEGIEADWVLHCFAAQTFTQEFDVVQSVFTGADPQTPADWRDAADIYKAWALTQPWCAQTYAQRPDVPAWMKDGPAMVRFSREWLAKPDLIERWMAEYWKKYFPSAPLITAYWGWEKIGSWVTPNYFPLFPSDEQFTNLVAHLRPLGCHAFPWPSGYHWTLMYQKQPDGSFLWDDRKHFDVVARPHAIESRDGKTYNRTPSWLRGGDTACMCPGDPWTINWWNNDICVPLAQRGSEMIQVDQVVGGGYPFCYSRSHAHPRGPGPWMTDVFTQQLQTMLTACRQIQPDAVVCFEEPNERFNHLVGIQDYRDCESKAEWASVFNYLYHEFLPTFQSNPRRGEAAWEAHCLVNGEIPHMVPSMRFGVQPLLMNGGFEEASSNHPPCLGWEQVHEYQGHVWQGKASLDGHERHGGAASLRLENVAKSDDVQVSQNVDVSPAGLAVGKKYRLSVWMKSEQLARPNAIGIGFLGSPKKWAGAHIVFPVAGTGWKQGSADFTVPQGAEELRIMLNVDGPAKVWVDDLKLAEIRPDGTTAEVMNPPTPSDHEFMQRWVELFHGEGRPYLLLGRMLHPPPLKTAMLEHHGQKMPAVMHNAFRAPDGSEAVVLANASHEKQTVRLLWKNQERQLDLEPTGILLVK